MDTVYVWYWSYIIWNIYIYIYNMCHNYNMDHHYLLDYMCSMYDIYIYMIFSHRIHLANFEHFHWEFPVEIPQNHSAYWQLWHFWCAFLDVYTHQNTLVLRETSRFYHLRWQRNQWSGKPPIVILPLDEFGDSAYWQVKIKVFMDLWILAILSIETSKSNGATVVLVTTWRVRVWCWLYDVCCWFHSLVSQCCWNDQIRSQIASDLFIFSLPLPKSWNVCWTINN